MIPNAKKPLQEEPRKMIPNANKPLEKEPGA